MNVELLWRFWIDVIVEMDASIDRMQTFLWAIRTMKSVLGTGLYVAVDQGNSKIRFLT
jgi:hypothetical protein